MSERIESALVSLMRGCRVEKQWLQSEQRNVEALEMAPTREDRQIGQGGMASAGGILYDRLPATAPSSPAR